jgi:hypoxanthine phosphoribosyltransferase
VKIDILEEDIRGKNILVVEDIFDSGTTIMKTKQVVESYGPSSLKIASLFHKRNPKNLVYNYYADYIGFVIPDEFVVGFGMDYNEAYRDLNHLCVINQAGIEYYK